MFLIFILIFWIIGVATISFQGEVEYSTLLLGMASIILIMGYFVRLMRQPDRFIYPHTSSIVQSSSRMLVLTGICLITFVLGHQHAKTALHDRLEKRVQYIEEKEIVVYINKINQLKMDQESRSIQQRAQVIDKKQGQSQTLLLYLRESKLDTTLELGRYYKVTGKLRPAHSYAVDGVFDHEKWLLQQNIAGTMRVDWIVPVSEAVLYSEGYLSSTDVHRSLIARLSLSIEKARLAFRDDIEQGVFRNKGLLVALLTGDKSLLTEQQEELFKKLGITHLLAISGPHVLIFAGLLSWFMGHLVSIFRPHIFLKVPKTYLLLIPFVCGVIIYSFFSGLEIPALRTTLSVCLISIAILFKFKIKPFVLLLISASLMLYLDPFSILSAAFWLSYGACLILIRVYQTIVHEQQSTALINKYHFLDKAKMYLKILLQSQWKIFIALLPFTLLIFQQISLLAPFANLVAVPMIGTLIVPLEVLGYCLSFIPFVGLFLFHLADMLISMLLVLLTKLGLILDNPLKWVALTKAQMFLLALAVLMFFMPKNVIPRLWIPVLGVALLMPKRDDGYDIIEILDIGQGQSILLQSSGKNALVDTGGSFDENTFSIGESVVVPFLIQRGISKLDQIFMSHLDQDHAGAYRAIEKHIQIDQVISNEKDDRFQQVKFDYCRQHQQVQLGKINIQFLSPAESQLNFVSQNRNELSCVIYLTLPYANDFKHLLIMGDAGWETEYSILKQYPELKVDILILGHHGSRHSSSYDFLKNTKPKIAIASAGFDNRYNHPHPVVKERLKALNIPLLDTQSKGSIRMTFDKNGDVQFRYHRDQKAWLTRNNPID
ncbi:DNA internalization-related competence protein ComEC/Rec2 [Acinetobacter sp. DSM 11652]|uniref:DNA internalization-related competence protein ComEC/Rec2 n=1 Tax=Acinetobacter sp. DSM 11652 TaxID=346222 RepID=UPI0008D7BFC9|nr:DNA internalization-related competence protein ComEC/Rec2 [Acinetobacter sp. DSM 11652]SEL73744.1 competence protein ComEC [Acinetobacter sp. DSM 11652]